MKNFLLFFLVTSVLTSCKIAVFDRYPGKSLDSYPREMQGTFLSDYTFESDSLLSKVEIKGRNAVLTNVNKDRDMDMSLSDSVVISKYKKLHFISMRSYDQEEGYGWNVFPIKLEKENFSIYHFFTNDTAAKTLLRTMKPVQEGQKMRHMDEKAYYKYCKDWMDRVEVQTFNRID